jgi:hypothetical protein
MFNKLFESVSDTLEDFIDDPFETILNIATQPISDGVEVLEGLTEGELRHKAALRLGADIALGMAVDELVEWGEENL